MELDVESVRKRLNMLGCSSFNDLALSFALDKVVNKIKNNCNVDVVPEGLKEIAIDMACGEYLLMLKATGQPIGSILDDLPETIKAIQEGDTKIDFAVSESNAPEALFQKLINYLCSTSEFAHYRRLTW